MATGMTTIARRRKTHGRTLVFDLLQIGYTEASLNARRQKKRGTCTIKQIEALSSGQGAQALRAGVKHWRPHLRSGAAETVH